MPATVPADYSFMPRFVANVDHQRLLDTRRAPYLCSDARFERYDDISPFLKAFMIPKYICPISLRGRSMCWSLGGLEALLCPDDRWAGYENGGKKNCQEVRRKYKSAVQIVYMVRKSTALSLTGYMTFECMADLYSTTSVMQEAGRISTEYPYIKLESLYKLKMYMFFGGEALKSEKNWPLWNSVWTTLWKAGSYWPWLWNARLLSHEEMFSGVHWKRKNGPYSTPRAAMEVWLGWLAVTLKPGEVFQIRSVFLKLVAVTNWLVTAFGLILVIMISSTAVKAMWIHSLK